MCQLIKSRDLKELSQAWCVAMNAKNKYCDYLLTSTEPARSALYYHVYHVFLLQEVMELQHCTDGPLEPLAGVSQVTHDVSILPPALHCARTSQIWRRRWPIMDSTEEMTQLMSSNNDARESSSVFNNSHTVHLEMLAWCQKIFHKNMCHSPSPDACLQHKLLPHMRSQQFLCCSLHIWSFVWNNQCSQLETAVLIHCKHQIQIHYSVRALMSLL